MSLKKTNGVGLKKEKIKHKAKYSTTSAQPSFVHPSPRFTLTSSLKMTTAIGVFADVSDGHRRSIAHGSEHHATRCTNTADPDGRTQWSPVVINKCIYFVAICNLIYYFQVVVDPALKYRCFFFNYKLLFLVVDIIHVRYNYFLTNMLHSLLIIHFDQFLCMNSSRQLTNYIMCGF